MWNHLLAENQGGRVEHITNGVHLPSWIGPEIGELLRVHLGPGFAENLLDPGFADAVQSIPDGELWEAHGSQKRRLVALARELALAQFARHGRSPDELRQVDRLLDPDALLVGFARRFATYKRADLLLRDLEQIKSFTADNVRPVQFLYAGKAHPADKPGQDLIQRIFHASLSPELHSRLLFLENYDMRVGRGLVQGVDVWLNNPRRPLEASGTSGMKAALNGGLNVSVLDGWWCEGYDPSHGWTIGEDREAGSDDEQDQRDAQTVYAVFREQIAPCFYARDEHGLPADWIRRMKLAIGTLSPRFSTSRMVREYTEQFYLPLARPVPSPTAAD
jgi:starch phosphorylase